MNSGRAALAVPAGSFCRIVAQRGALPQPGVNLAFRKPGGALAGLDWPGETEFALFAVEVGAVRDDAGVAQILVAVTAEVELVQCRHGGAPCPENPRTALHRSAL